jgi:hypothetical protein
VLREKAPSKECAQMEAGRTLNARCQWPMLCLLFCSGKLTGEGGPTHEAQGSQGHRKGGGKAFLPEDRIDSAMRCSTLPGAAACSRRALPHWGPIRASPAAGHRAITVRAGAVRKTIPIFPLGLVALPEATVPLMIFEAVSEIFEAMHSRIWLMTWSHCPRRARVCGLQSSLRKLPQFSSMTFGRLVGTHAHSVETLLVGSW